MANPTSKDNPGALFVPAGIIGGMGVGFLIDNVAAGMFIGLGLGFVAFAVTSIVYRDK